jgi:uncharacterized membrane protein
VERQRQAHGTLIAVADRERDLERLLTFVDAVVAIAITLLVLPLAEVGSQIHDSTTVAQLLADRAADIYGFLLSFVVIARLWVGQHRIVSSLVRQSTTLIWLLIGWSFTIVFLPFPTTLVTDTDNDNLAKVLYLGTMAVSSMLLSCIAYEIGRHRSLRDTEHKPDIRQSVGTTIAFVLALVISVAIPGTSYYPLLLLVLVDPAVRLLRHVRPVGDR